MKRYIPFTIGATMFILMAIVLFPQSKATAAGVIYGKNTSNATGTLSYMTPGTGTTTLLIDSYVGDVAPGNYINSNTVIGTVADSATILIQYTASTSNTILRARQEISQDGIDWYPVSTLLASNSTSTPIVGTYGDYQWSISTSTASTAGQIGLGGTSNGMRMHQSLTITNFPTRYTRILFYIPPGSSNGGIWTEQWLKKVLPQ